MPFIHSLTCVCVCVCQNASYVQRPDPDLPVCVERTVLVWFPLFFLWLCAPWHFTSFCKKSAKAPASRLYICKQVKSRDVSSPLSRHISFA